MAEPSHFTDSPTSYTKRWWAYPHHRNHPIDRTLQRSNYTWNTLDYEGSSQTRTRIEAQGTQEVTVTHPRIRREGDTSPGAWVPVTIDGGTWWIRLGAAVTIPNAAVTILQDAGFGVA